MSHRIKNICECRIISNDCRESFLPLGHAGALILREHDLSLGGISDLRKPYSIGRTNSSFHLLLYTLSGGGALQTSTGNALLRPGELLIMPAHTPHLYSIRQSRWRILWFHLRKRKTWSSLDGRPWRILASSNIERMRNAVEGLLLEVERAEGGEERGIELYCEIITRLLRREVNMAGDPHNRRMERLLRELWMRVEAQISMPWPVSRLARMLHMSRGHFHRVVVQHHGAPPREVVFRLRMQRAELLLSHTDDTAAEIAARVGYQNPFAFSVAFKRFKGCCPRKFRESRKATSEEDIRPAEPSPAG